MISGNPGLTPEDSFLYRIELDSVPGSRESVTRTLIAFAAFAASSAAYGQQGTMQGSGAVLTDAPTTEQEAAPSTAGRDEKSERLICRRLDNTTSRMNRRQVCLTAREWRERQD